MKTANGFQSLGHYIFNRLDGQARDKIIFIDVESGREWTGHELKIRILNVATALRDLYGFEQGTAVCISFDNSDLTLILALAVISLGGIVASAYSKDPYAELLYMAKKVEPSYLFCHRRNLHWAKQLEIDMGYPMTSIIMEQLPSNGHQPSQLDERKHFHYLYNYRHSLSQSLCLIPVACRQLDLDVGLIMMSSGTTGNPKAIAVTHANCISELMYLEERSFNRPNNIRFACSASLDYVSGRLILFGAIAVGYTSIIMDGFQPRAYLSAIERYKINIVYLGAASFYNLITYKDLNSYDISSVRVVFPMGAKVTYLSEMAKFLAEHPHIVQVKQGFGASELAGGAMKTMTPKEYLGNSECCGQLMSGMEAKIVDLETGQQVLGPNKQGILRMRGSTMFPGYYDMERVRKGISGSPFIRDQTVFDSDGFYITGDLAYFNEDQELFIVGRLKETMCCRAGKKVLPQELEQVIGQHEAVDKVCVVAIPNEIEMTLHCPRAFVVARPDLDLQRYASSSRSNGSKPTSMDRADQEELKFRGSNKLCRRLSDDNLRRKLMMDIMSFVDERVGWEKQLTGGLVLLDDMPTLRETGKVNKGYLRALSLEQIELYGDRSSSSSSTST